MQAAGKEMLGLCIGCEGIFLEFIDIFYGGYRKI